MRLLPAAAAIVFVLAVFLPSHWRFEPAESDDIGNQDRGELAGLAHRCPPNCSTSILKPPDEFQTGAGGRGASACRPDLRIVVAGEYERLEDWLAGTLRIIREIARMAGKKG